MFVFQFGQQFESIYDFKWIFEIHFSIDFIVYKYWSRFIFKIDMKPLFILFQWQK